MNKYQGALSRLRSDLNFDKWFGFNEEDYELIEELVQKATPIEPIYRDDSHRVDFYWKCPRCGRYLCDHGEESEYGFYCVDCGQRIMWDEEEEE